MWRVLVVIFGVFPIVVKSAWVEIPQVPSKKSQFVFGSPTFLVSKYSTTTVTNNYKTLMTTMVTPKTTVVSTTPVPVSQLKRPIMSNRMDETLNLPLKQEVNEKIRSSVPILKNNTENEVKPDKNNGYLGFLPLLNSIQQTLIMKAKKSLKSKISLLTNLRDNLLMNIDELMTKVWNNNKQDEALPEARGHHDEHEMDFPSNEGALLTIGFLTFAVFLIKLVLKLIHALKNKQTTTTMMGMTDMTNGVTNGMTTGMATYFGRKKRDVSDYDSLQILQLIDEYKFS